jgi:short-subunit dehydrogenase
MKAVITGASRGFGKAIAEEFGAAGYDLVLCSLDPTRLSDSAEALKKKFHKIKVTSHPADLSDIDSVKKFAGWIHQQSGTIDVLVNNAGSFLPGNVSDEEDGQLERMLAVNLFSAYHLTRALLPSLIKQKHGHIFNMCSIASLQAYRQGGSYSISKFALAGFSKNLREELKQHGIKVTAVYPGAAYTDSWARSGIDPKRIMEAADIARLIYAAACLSPQACVEDIVVRPQLGDL